MSYGRRAFPLLVLAAVACSGSDAFTPHPTASVREQPAKKYTMLLGNSLSFGFQPDKDVFNPAQFNTGFGTLFVERLNARVGRPRHCARAALRRNRRWQSGVLRTKVVAC